MLLNNACLFSPNSLVNHITQREMPCCIVLLNISFRIRTLKVSFLQLCKDICTFIIIFLSLWGYYFTTIQVANPNFVSNILKIIRVQSGNTFSKILLSYLDFTLFLLFCTTFFNNSICISSFLFSITNQEMLLINNIFKVFFNFL